MSPSWLLRVVVDAGGAVAAGIGNDSGFEVDDGLGEGVSLIRFPFVNIVDDVDDVVTGRFAIRVRALRNLSKLKEHDMTLQLKGTPTLAVKHKLPNCDSCFIMAMVISAIKTDFLNLKF